MRIAMLHADLPPEARGGVAHQVSRLADVLARRGHDVVVHTLSPQPEGVAYTTAAVPLGHLLRGRKLATKVGLAAAFAAIRTDADVLHAHGDSHLLLGRRAPVVRTFYGSALDESAHAERALRRASQRVMHVAERASRRAATITVGISQATAASVGALDRIIPCGVDRDRFWPGEKSPAPSVLFIGTMGGRKRGHLVHAAFLDLVRPRFPDAELWLVGPDRIEGAGVSAHGWVSDERLGELLRSAWVLAVPSSYEGFGVPAIEAMASGTAVVATDNPGSREVLGGPDGVGLVVDDAGFGPALLGLLADDAARQRREVVGRERSAAFDWSVVAEQYEGVYREAIGRSTHGASC